MPLGPFVDIEFGYKFETHDGSIHTEMPEQVRHLWTLNLGLGYEC